MVVVLAVLEVGREFVVEMVKVMVLVDMVVVVEVVVLVDVVVVVDGVVPPPLPPTPAPPPSSPSTISCSTISFSSSTLLLFLSSSNTSTLLLKSTTSEADTSFSLLKPTLRLQTSVPHSCCCCCCCRRRRRQDQTSQSVASFCQNDGFEQFDLVAVKQEKDKDPELIMVAQMKEGGKSANKSPNSPAQFCKEAVTALWLRGKAPQDGVMVQGWYQASQQEMDEFLGLSLAAAVLSQWRDLPDTEQTEKSKVVRSLCHSCRRVKLRQIAVVESKPWTTVSDVQLAFGSSARDHRKTFHGLSPDLRQGATRSQETKGFCNAPGGFPRLLVLALLFGVFEGAP